MMDNGSTVNGYGIYRTRCAHTTAMVGFGCVHAPCHVYVQNQRIIDESLMNNESMIHKS